ncbi:MAG: M56 family metallopeptidase, partial [Myxococcota bacterium]
PLSSQAAIGGAHAYSVSLWSVGATLLGARLLTGIWQWRQILRSTEPFPRGQRYSDSVPVLLSPRAPVPMTGGVFRPKIVLPETATNCDNDSLKAIVLHELAHVKNRDALWTLLSYGVLLAHWWNPALWWLRRQLLLSMELAADSQALNAGASPIRLAEVLVRVTEDARVPIVAASGSNLGQRVEALMQGQQPRNLRSSWPARTAPMVIALLAACGGTPEPDGQVGAPNVQSAETGWTDSIRTNVRSLTSCFEEAINLDDLGASEIEFLLSWETTPNGRTQFPKVSQSTLPPAPELMRCMVREMEEWRFPERTATTPVLNYPVRLRLN